MRHVLVYITGLLFISYTLVGQSHMPVLTDLEGDSLIAELQRAYKPFTVLTYKDARELMYRELYNQNDSVVCVYTGHKVYLDPGTSDAVAYVYRNGQANGINCEHTFPQSLGAGDGNARSDMYHLFPTRSAVNEARSNLPFGEIDDASTLRWFVEDREMSRKPGTGIDDYSEWINQRFEPREDHKGNVARAIFYFVTMYREQANLPYFEEQREDLCNWHGTDPVDEKEWLNNQRIASFQSGKPNPFILDCTLAYRAYCPDNTPCTPQTSVWQPGASKCSLIPQDSFGKSWTLTGDFPRHIVISVYDLQGRLLHDQRLITQTDKADFTIERQLAPGMYVLHLTDVKKNRRIIARSFAVTFP